MHGKKHKYKSKEACQQRFCHEKATICKRRFKPDEIKRAIGFGRKAFVNNAIPSVFDVLLGEGSRVTRKRPTVRLN